MLRRTRAALRTARSYALAAAAVAPMVLKKYGWDALAFAGLPLIVAGFWHFSRGLGLIAAGVILVIPAIRGGGR